MRRGNEALRRLNRLHLSRVQRLRAVDEEAALLCERLASNAAASSRSMWATSAASCARSHACGAQPSLHVGGLRSASSAWAVKGRLARPWSGSAAGQISSLGWRHGWRAQRPWTSAVLLHVRRSHGGTAGSVAGMRPALLPHSLSHKAWLHWQLQRLGQPQLQQGAPAAAWRDLSWGGVRAWNSYSMTSYTPKLPHWFRSRLPDMPEGWWAEPGVWVPRDWALRPSYQTRVAIINALYAAGENVQRLAPVMLAEAVRHDRFAQALTGPPREVSLATGKRKPRAAFSLLARAARVLYEVSADLLRALWLIVLFAPLAVTAPVCLNGARRQEWLHYLRQVLEAAGPAFIKWGQWAATRADMFPPDFCAAMEQLHTQAPTHSLRFTKRAIAQAFDASVEDLFDDFEATPLASGSIGQVYRARLSEQGARNTGIDAGTLVAVKVRHPGVGQVIQRDFALMMRVARLASLLPLTAHLRLEDTLSQFAAPLREQVDLALEARHLWQFNYNFRHARNVRFPFPIYPLVAPEVLVETFEAGDGISRYVAEAHLRRSAFNSRLARLGSQTMLQMMLVDNLIHSDLHPGNILVTLDPPPGPLLSTAAAFIDRFHPFGLTVPQSWREPGIVLLDVGMATHLEPADQERMLALFQAFSRLDGREIGDCTLLFSGDHQTCPDPEGFKDALQQYFTDIQQEAAWVDTNGAEAMSAVLELVRRHKVNMPGHICAVVVTTLVLEGWSSKLDPKHSVLEQVESIVSPKSSWGQRLGKAVDIVMTEQAPLAGLDYV